MKLKLHQLPRGGETPPRQRLEAVPKQPHGSAQNTVPEASK